ncbi:hypothetical protein H634G_04078 [Metarhizium anisopliae BRIP 53293]|uniref:Uncharacterized protein n=1 Tax=Metarhizium anisopliae BRIP 53293 TaxID=1291518 RepID=A0A0D9P0Q3_METAN|nr:hypothetical protein H634G_04078 [Metarhizium anisopliae BRIP 53293]
MAESIRDQIQNVLYDIGHVHPDLEGDYAFFSVSTVELVSAYDTSISKGLVRPTSMYNPYLNYLESPKADISRHIFDDAETLETFRSTFTMTFEMDVG